MLLRETLELVERDYETNSGKRPLLIYIDNKMSDESTYPLKDKLPEYKMSYLPQKLGSKAPHTWGWVLYDRENDKLMPYVKKFIEDVPGIEIRKEGEEKRTYDEITNKFSEVVKEMLKSINAAEKAMTKGQINTEIQQKLSSFRDMLQNELGNEETQKFIQSMIEFRKELKKHHIYNLSWSNMMLAMLSRNMQATEVRPKGEWDEMKYKVKEGIAPIMLIGTGAKYIRLTPAEREIRIEQYLKENGANSVDELVPSALYNLKKRVLRGKKISGSEYTFTYEAFDRMDMEPLEGAEMMPEEPNQWWDAIPADEKDEVLTAAIIKFAQSKECGEITINLDNSQAGLQGARGNATNTGEINLVNDEYMKFPTAVHELTHQLRHWEYASMKNPALKRFYNRNANRDILEQEAELCATFVISNYGYNLQPHLNYVYHWGLGKDNCNQVLDDIAETADFIEKGVEKYTDKKWKQQTEKN